MAMAMVGRSTTIRTGYAKGFAICGMLIVLILPRNALTATVETIQPGFVLFDPGNATLRLSDVRSGELCADMGDTDQVCTTDTRLTVQGRDSCAGTDGVVYPCTRYGYQFDYAGAVPGARIECTATRRDPFNRQERSYTVELDSESGTVYQPTWIPYAPVERRSMLTEVHECTYLGNPFATIEYIISYEPSASLAPFVDSGPSPEVDEPYLPGVPQACDHLTEDLAAVWAGGTVQKNLVDHVPNLRSHCAYSAIRDAHQTARIEFKFRPYEMFDVEKLNPMQLVFNAAFSGSGNEPDLIHRDLGKISFVYQIPPNRTVLMVITGIQGPPDGAGRPMELALHYDVRDDRRNSQQRLECINYLAEQTMAYLFSNVRASDNRVVLDEPPDIDESCKEK